jgi:hypothetical protein
VEELLAERGLDVSYETVRSWVLKFGPIIARRLRRSRPAELAVSPDNSTVAIGDCLGGRMWYAAFTTGPTMGIPGSTPDPLHLTFQGVKAGTYMPGNGCPDGIQARKP